jgi:hypothetical protein
MKDKVKASSKSKDNLNREDLEDNSQKKINPGLYLLFYKYTDMSNQKYFYCLAIWRLILAIWGTKNYIHPDEYWQGTEIAYSMVYGGVTLPWEWSTENRIRNVLYPFYLSLYLRILDLLHLDYYFLLRAAYYIG